MVETTFLSDRDQENIDKVLQAFATQWNQTPDLAEMTGKPVGAGAATDIWALDYIIYEALYSEFSINEKDFTGVSTAVFGNCLRQLLGFEWCCLDLWDGPAIGVQQSQDGFRIGLSSAIAAKLSGRPHFGSFESLFFDIYWSSFRNKSR
jgi:hypothetical protein